MGLCWRGYGVVVSVLDAVSIRSVARTNLSNTTYVRRSWAAAVQAFEVHQLELGRRWSGVAELI